MTKHYKHRRPKHHIRHLPKVDIAINEGITYKNPIRRNNIRYKQIPIHLQMDKYKNKSYPYLRKRFNIHPSADDDRDKVPNYNDCRPWDKKRQDEDEGSYDSLSPEEKEKTDRYWKARNPTEEEYYAFKEIHTKLNHLQDIYFDLKTNKEGFKIAKEEYINAIKEYEKIGQERYNKFYDGKKFEYDSPDYITKYLEEPD